MPAELFAIISAVFLAISGVIARIALNKRSSPFTAFLTFGSATVIVWLLIAILGLELPNKAGAIFFSLRGILDPGIAAFLIYVAIRKVGVIFTVPIIAASPLVSTTLSIIFLKESLTLIIALGTLLIIFGAVLLNFKHNKNIAHLKYITFAVVGSVIIGVSAFITKFTLNISDTPISGLAFSFTMGIIIQILIITFLRKWKDLKMDWKIAKIFYLAGLFVSFGFMFRFLALSQGALIIVAPLVSIMPLFTLFLSRILLKKHETITKNVVIGTIFIVIGASVLVLV